MELRKEILRKMIAGTATKEDYIFLQNMDKEPIKPIFKPKFGYKIDREDDGLSDDNDEDYSRSRPAVVWIPKKVPSPILPIEPEIIQYQKEFMRKADFAITRKLMVKEGDIPKRKPSTYVSKAKWDSSAKKQAYIKQKQIDYYKSGRKVNQKYAF